MCRQFVFGWLALILCGCDADVSKQLSQTASAESSRLEADVRFLADDALEGREAGTRGYDLAALYVAERFRALGLNPGGDEDTYFQSVPMLEFELGESSTLEIANVDLVAGEDYLFNPSSKAETIDIGASLVFCGFCFASELHDRDDFEGLDLKGKAAVYMVGAPKFLDSEERAHHRAAQRVRVSAEGAAARISVWTETRERVLPFERLAKFLAPGYSRMTWTDKSGSPFSSAPNIQADAVLSLSGGAKLFNALGQDWEEILQAAESKTGDVDPIDLGVEARFRVESFHRRVNSSNVVGILRGKDPDLANEYVILIAHLDHEGVRPTPEEGDDEIYNGAMDNAAGVSAMLEVARILKDSPPKRSIVFLAVTAEEKGLNGSDYFARNPTVPAEGMVAVVNLDMPIMTYPFSDIIALGAERSTLHAPVRSAVQAHELRLSPDPAPERGSFTRSDHYMFVKQGVPSVYLKPGFANGGEEAQTTFVKTHYSQPSDEVDLIDFDELRRFTDVKSEMVRNIANMPERPVWNAGDFFGTVFNGPMAPE